MREYRWYVGWLGFSTRKEARAHAKANGGKVEDIYAQAAEFWGEVFATVDAGR